MITIGNYLIQVSENTKWPPPHAVSLRPCWLIAVNIVGGKTDVGNLMTKLHFFLFFLQIYVTGNTEARSKQKQQACELGLF